MENIITVCANFDICNKKDSYSYFFPWLTTTILVVSFHIPPKCNENNLHRFSDCKLQLCIFIFQTNNRHVWKVGDQHICIAPHVLRTLQLIQTSFQKFLISFERTFTFIVNRRITESSIKQQCLHTSVTVPTEVSKWLPFKKFHPKSLRNS